MVYIGNINYLKFVLVVAGDDDIIDLVVLLVQVDVTAIFKNELTFKTIRHNCVASRSCWRFPMRGSITKCSLISVIRQRAVPP